MLPPGPLESFQCSNCSRSVFDGFRSKFECNESTPEPTPGCFFSRGSQWETILILGSNETVSTKQGPCRAGPCRAGPCRAGPSRREGLPRSNEAAISSSRGVRRWPGAIKWSSPVSKVVGSRHPSFARGLQLGRLRRPTQRGGQHAGWTAERWPFGSDVLEQHH